MKPLTSYFEDFLRDIRPTDEQRAEFVKAHGNLKDRLSADKDLEKIIVATFLQGSYRRATLIRPENGKKSDIDLIVVTKLHNADVTPEAALGKFTPFAEKHYKGNWELQGRSIKLYDGETELDLVVTAAPSEQELGILLKAKALRSNDTLEDSKDWRLSESWISLAERGAQGAKRLIDAALKEDEWKLSPLLIPDREAQKWEETHPLVQIQWTRDKNSRCNGHYINVVKAIKWWRRLKHLIPKYPKGYPVEHLVGANCPDKIDSVAEGIVFTLEAIVKNYRQTVNSGLVPALPDHGVPTHNVFKRITAADFAQFYGQVTAAAGVARAALEAATTEGAADEWQKLFGDKFPGGTKKSGGGFTPRTQPTTLGGPRFG